ncbi:hypothetical protein PSPO01_13388 [Paraphaeosphaeria sporulosa]
MRALSYLAHAIALRTSPFTPDTAKCSPTLGVPGGGMSSPSSILPTPTEFPCTAYICPIPSACTWHPPSSSPACITLETSVSGPPTLIGPDAGGQCLLYSSPACAPESVLVVPEDAAGAGQTDETKGSVVCPRIGGAVVPGGVRGVRCFATGAGKVEAKEGEDVKRPLGVPLTHGTPGVGHYWGRGYGGGRDIDAAIST